MPISLSVGLHQCFVSSNVIFISCAQYLFSRGRCCNGCSNTIWLYCWWNDGCMQLPRFLTTLRVFQVSNPHRRIISADFIKVCRLDCCARLVCNCITSQSSRHVFQIIRHVLRPFPSRLCPITLVKFKVPPTTYINSVQDFRHTSVSGQASE